MNRVKVITDIRLRIAIFNRIEVCETKTSDKLLRHGVVKVVVNISQNLTSSVSLWMSSNRCILLYLVCTLYQPHLIRKRHNKPLIVTGQCHLMH